MELNDDTNFLLQGFPERLEEDQLLALLAENVSISWAKNQPKAKRKNVLQTLPQDWFFVNSYCHELYDIFYDTFYQTFRWRHQDNFVPLLNATKEWHENAGRKGYTPPMLNDFNVDGFSIIGISGVGKTFCTRKILRKCFPQLINRDGTIQITYLITNCVHIGSLKELLVKFLSEVDRLIGTTYVRDYVNSKNSTEKLEAIVANVALRHHIGIWLIEECHHLKSVPFRSAEQIINFLKNVTAVIGMPIVFIGTPEVKSILGGNFQIGRRAEGNGSIFWDQYTRESKNDGKGVKDKVEDEWTLLLTSLWKRQVLRNPGKLTKELIDAYYEKSQGIMKRLLAIHIRAQVMAMDSDEERITPESIYEARKYFQFTDPMISALGSGKQELIFEYPDLSMRAFNLVDSVSSKKLTDKEVVDLVLNSDFSKEEVVMIFNALLKKKLGVEKDKQSPKDTGRPPKKNDKTKTKAPKPTGDLLDAIGNKTTAEELYEAMKNHGVTDIEGKI